MISLMVLYFLKLVILHELCFSAQIKLVCLTDVCMQLCELPTHVKELQVAKISGAFHCGVSHTHSWFWDVKPQKSCELPTEFLQCTSG